MDWWIASRFPTSAHAEVLLLLAWHQPACSHAIHSQARKICNMARSLPCKRPLINKLWDLSTEVATLTQIGTRLFRRSEEMNYEWKKRGTYGRKTNALVRTGNPLCLSYARCPWGDGPRSFGGFYEYEQYQVANKGFWRGLNMFISYWYNSYRTTGELLLIPSNMCEIKVCFFL